MANAELIKLIHGFNKYKYLTKCYIDFSNLKQNTVSGTIFQDLLKLEAINLSGNQLSVIEKNIFENLDF